MATALNLKTRTSELRDTDILHLMRDPDTGSRQDLGLTGATINGMSRSRALADRLYFSGASGTRAVTPLGALAAGLGDFTIVCEAVEWPAAPGSSELGVTLLTNAAGGTGGYGSVPNSFHVGLGTGGIVRVMLGTDTDYRRYDISSASIYTPNVGRSTDLVFRRSAGVLSVFCSGVSVTLPTEATLGSPAAWSDPLSFSWLTQGEIYSGASWKGRMGPQYLYNCAWSDAEILTHAQTGRHPSWGELTTGSMIPIISPTANNGGFETTGAGGADVFAYWGESTNAGGAITRDTSEFHGGASSCKLAIPAASLAYAVIYSPPGTFIPGAKYHLEFWAKTDVTGGTLGVQDVAASVNLIAPIALTTTWTKYAIDFIAPSSQLKFTIASSTTAMTAYIDDVSANAYGPIAHPDFDPNYGIRDLGPNGLHGWRTSGTNYLGAKNDSDVVAKVSHSGAGPLQFASGAILNTTKGWVIDSLIVRSTAAVTWSLGNVSAGAQHVSAYSLAVGDNYIPSASIVTRLLSTANLWSQSSGAADITIFAKLRRTF